MSAAYFDWSGGAIHVLHDDTDNVQVYPNLDTLLDGLTEPTSLFGEATFESFAIENRKAFMGRCVDEGHDLKVIHPRATAKRRRKLGYEDKTDEIDVNVIRHLAKDGKSHFAFPTLPTEDLVERREAANKKLMRLRSTKIKRDTKRSPRGWVLDSAKDEYAKSLVQKLPDFNTLTPSQKAALGTNNEKSYSLCTVAAVAVAAEFARNRKEFDFLSGLYQNGYPSQIRSDLHLHRWWGSEAHPGVRSKLTLTDFRRECRWMYHQLKGLV